MRAVLFPALDMGDRRLLMDEIAPNTMQSFPPAAQPTSYPTSELGNYAVAAPIPEPRTRSPPSLYNGLSPSAN